MLPQAFSARFAEPPRHGWVVSELRQGVGQRDRITRGDQQSRLAVDDHLGDGRHPRGDDRPPRGHGLEQHQPEAFPDRGHGEDVDGVHQRRHVLARPEHVHPIGHANF